MGRYNTTGGLRPQATPQHHQLLAPGCRTTGTPARRRGRRSARSTTTPGNRWRTAIRGDRRAGFSVRLRTATRCDCGSPSTRGNETWGNKAMSATDTSPHRKSAAPSPSSSIERICCISRCPASIRPVGAVSVRWWVGHIQIEMSCRMASTTPSDRRSHARAATRRTGSAARARAVAVIQVRNDVRRAHHPHVAIYQDRNFTACVHASECVEVGRRSLGRETAGARGLSGRDLR